MKQRLAGKIIKHRERYTQEMVLMAYNKSVRGLRRFYMRIFRTDDTWMKAYYRHKASAPYYELCDDVDDLWKVKE